MLDRPTATLNRVWNSPVTGAILAITAVVTIVIALAGCMPSIPQNQRAESTIQQEQRETVTGSATTDLVNRSISAPAPTKITVPGKTGDQPTVVEVPQVVASDITGRATASETSNSKASGSATWSWAVQVPFLIAVGFGLLMIAIALALLYWLVKKSKALTAAWNVGDEFMAGGINTIRTMAMSETDPKAASVLSAVVSSLEQQRANFNKD